jgi:hypothetical protein
VAAQLRRTSDEVDYLLIPLTYCDISMEEKCNIVGEGLDCAILRDPELVKRFPEIKEVAACLYGISRLCNQNFSTYDPFDRLGVKNVDEYLSLVSQGEQEALRFYEAIRKSCQRKVE